MAEKNFPTLLIDGGGLFNRDGIEAFMKAVNLAECGQSYAVVSIMGPQSSGKSTLLNHLFHTNFREMDANKGRSQTTEGIWLARAVDIDPCTFVLDLEGSDGRERGEDGTAFEKQSALFALAVSDILLINVWNKDIGRVNAASMPLLKTVFQTMTRLFKLRKTTLLFVIRDIGKTPLKKLERILREDIQEIWVSVDKKEQYKENPVDKFFNVEVVALPSYEEKEEQFKEQVAILRKRFYHSIAPGGLAGDRQALVPAAGFSFSAQQIWKVIKENKDLNLPTHKIMVATVRCEEIANEKLVGFSSDEVWRRLEEAVQHGLIRHFGKKLSLLLDKCLSGYDKEALYFDSGVRTTKRIQLESKLLQLAFPAYQSMLDHLRSKTVDDFKEAFHKALQREEDFAVAVRDCTQSVMSKFDVGCAEATIKQAEWNGQEARENIRRDIDVYVASASLDLLLELKTQYEEAANALNNRNRQLDAQYEEAVKALNNRNRQLDAQHKEAMNALNNRNRQLDVQHEELNNRNRQLDAQQQELNNRNRQLNAQPRVAANRQNNGNMGNNIFRGLKMAVKLGSLTAHILSGGIIPHVDIGQ